MKNFFFLNERGKNIKQEQKARENKINRKLNQVVTGSRYPIKIYILGSCDKYGFDMAAGVSLCDVRIEETLKIRIGMSIKT